MIKKNDLKIFSKNVQTVMSTCDGLLSLSGTFQSISKPLRVPGAEKNVQPERLLERLPMAWIISSVWAEGSLTVAILPSLQHRAPLALLVSECQDFSRRISLQTTTVVYVNNCLDLRTRKRTRRAKKWKRRLKVGKKQTRRIRWFEMMDQIKQAGELTNRRTTLINRYKKSQQA